MAVDLARTFLEIVRCGSFVGAAEHLHLTQAAITARVQSLESQLNCSLFVRNRSGARLTPDGEAFVDFANRMVIAWEAAQQELPLPQSCAEILHIGGEPSLCNPLMLKWVLALRQAMPRHAVHSHIGDGVNLLRRLEQGALDAALVYHPLYWQGVQVELLMEEKLVQVRNPHQPGPYVFVDWGEDFRHRHNAALPQNTRAEVSFNLGPLALQYILESGGAGYFRTRVIQSYLDCGMLELVPQAPEFTYPVYLLYSRDRCPASLRQAIECLRDVVAHGSDWSQRWDPMI
ncbi:MULTISPECIES: LysR family transcriptional regulator [unclassified Pseudomonas]|uniref:LysR family transcriptional regulator n=1 Tax=unclassified Pseudomonas TaxID=196821 RepID=UPI00244C81A1|nr:MULTISPECIES: LysR family transcriptional regulator [unclassified Pseudomonas]MDG9931055.1 LysR family transcriptional regulator [Pseudomonas sp. GD04042]MDH0485510.1 LysR family transcriptional regulator [Pseudomonas sp. GD04015]MDH0606656.1 LysR family transcriptional regulator [Pseudomonas sp. GD03869]